MGATRDDRRGYPYDPMHDYRGFAVDRDRDSPLVGTNEASRRLRLASLQAVRGLIDAGRLPALLGDQARNKRRLVPLWAVDGLAKHRHGDAHGVGGDRATEPSRRSLRTVAVAWNEESEAVLLRRELARLQAENNDLRFAWAALREGRRLLDEADRDREAALEHVRSAERRQSEAAMKAARAAALQTDALTVLVMPKDGAGAHADAFPSGGE